MAVMRSIMYVPGNNPKMVEKAPSIPADIITLDLEDSVPPSEKEAARKLVAEKLKYAGSGGAQVYVRINNWETEMTNDDLEAVVWEGLDGVTLAKTGHPDDVKRLDWKREELERRRGIPVGTVKISMLLETAKGIMNAYECCMASSRNVNAIFGAVDTLELCLKTVTPMLDTMKTIPANMRRAAAKGFINATDCADYLTKKGMPFRDAYKLTGCMVSDCIAKDKTLEELTLDEFKGYSGLFEGDIYEAIDLVKCCEGRTSYGRANWSFHN